MEEKYVVLILLLLELNSTIWKAWQESISK